MKSKAKDYDSASLSMLIVIAFMALIWVGTAQGEVSFDMPAPPTPTTSGVERDHK